MGVFARIMMGLAEQVPDNKAISIDATYLKAHRTASSLGLKKRGRGRLIGQTKGGMNTKLHAVTNTRGRPVRFFITAGQVSDYTGAAALMNGLPEADWSLADRGYDADWFREGRIDTGTPPCIPGQKSRKTTIKYDKRRYKRRNRIKRMFSRIKDWRRVAKRYDRSPTVFLSAIILAATVIFWLRVLSLRRY
jgi:transposase